MSKHSIVTISFTEPLNRALCRRIVCFFALHLVVCRAAADASEEPVVARIARRSYSLDAERAATLGSGLENNRTNKKNGINYME